MPQFHRAHASSTILVIDSDALMLTALGGALDMQGHKAILARSEQVAAQALDTEIVDLIILSIDQLEAGCSFADRLRTSETAPEVPIIFIVPELASEWAAQLQQRGGVFCALRSIDPHHLLDLVEKALWLPHVARRRAAQGAAHPGPTHLGVMRLGKNSDWVTLD
ncbi:MAG: hypothetical protein ACTHOU_08275 [Aureliella sp.]